MLFCRPLFLVILVFWRDVSAGIDVAYGDDTDLTTFVTRPEIRAPIFNITGRVTDGISQGLWFLAPYANVAQDHFASYLYQACSTGPHLYDGDGNLVWSGACAFQNQNTCDFRLFTDENGETEHLSMIFHGYKPGLREHGGVLDSSYRFAPELQNITSQPFDNGFNMHEFKIIDGGRRALYIMTREERVKLPVIDGMDLPSIGWVANIGFREVDLRNGNIIFEWWALDVDMDMLTESSSPHQGVEGPHPQHWNWFHPNSIDKSAEGDYIISGRFVDTVYKISGQDGSILWRLGGPKSSFQLDKFNFSKQHDAQFLGYDSSGAELISLFDNAQALQQKWQSKASATTSSCLIIALDHRSMIARLVQQIWRPDGAITQLRGNFQHLPNGNTVAGWSENGYVSEHAPDGSLLLEGRFASERFVTYRAYKFEFTGHPVEPIALKTFVYGVTPTRSTTVWYVSWNGATEVVEWSFCRESVGTRSRVVGTTAKTGFETTFISDGLEGRVFVEAIAKNGSVIGRSDVQHAVWPVEWGRGSATGEPATLVEHHGKHADDHLTRIKTEL